MTVRKQIFWGCGYSFLACQWLSNGTFGSTWLPEYGSLGLPAFVGQIIVYANYVIVLGLAILGSNLLFPINERPFLKTIGTIGVALGNAFCVLAGCGFVTAWVYPVGTWCISTGITILYLGWGEYYCAIGSRNACIVISLNLVIGSILFALLGFVATLNFMVAAFTLVAIIPLSQFFMACGWRSLGEARRQFTARNKKQFPVRALWPYIVVVTTFGLSLGILIGFVRLQDMATPPFVWTMGMCLMCFLILFMVLRRPAFDYLRYARFVSPVLIICLLLIPLFWHSSFSVVCVLVCAAYMSANVFYQITYVEISHTGKTALLPLIACGTGADAVGVVVGESLCDALGLFGFLSFEAIYLLVLLVASLILLVTVRYLRDQELQLLWGFRERDTGLNIQKCCERMTERVSLTPREEEVLEALVRGRSAQEIADELVVSLATVRTHARNLYKKVGVHSQTELINKVLYDENS